MAIVTSQMVGGGNYTSIAGGSLDMLPVLLKKKLLMYLEKNLVFDRYADKESLPEGNGKVVRFTRYPRVGLPFDPAQEGITPTDLRELAPEVVEAAVDQWIDVGGVTDVAEMTVAHKPLQILIDRMGTGAAELVDREHQRTLRAAGNVVFTDPSYTSRSQITQNDFLNADTLRRVIAGMRDDGVPDFDGQYLIIHDNFTNMDMQKDSVFATASSSAGTNSNLFKGLLAPEWLGGRWVRTNHIPYIEREATLSAIVPTTDADAANTLAANCDVKIVGLTMFGFEKYISDILTPGGFAPNDVVSIVIPTISGIAKYDVYAGPVGGTLRRINTVRLNAGTYRITSTGNTALSGTALLYSTTGDVAPTTPAAGVKVHQTYVMGREAFGSVELQGIEVNMTPRVASDTDPAIQRRKVSYKLMFKTVIKNTQFFKRIEHESEFD